MLAHAPESYNVGNDELKEYMQNTFVVLPQLKSNIYSE